MVQIFIYKIAILMILYKGYFYNWNVQGYLI